MVILSTTMLDCTLHPAIHVTLTDNTFRSSFSGQKRQPVADALDEDRICRKTRMIVDELAQNKDFKVRVGLQGKSWTTQWTTGNPHVVVAMVTIVTCGMENTEKKGLVLLSV